MENSKYFKTIIIILLLIIIIINDNAFILSNIQTVFSSLKYLKYLSMVDLFESGFKQSLYIALDLYIS